MYGKLLIQCDLVVLTGLHIGASGGFTAIGGVDSPIARDLRTGRPIVPGSSLKGKLRALLTRSLSQSMDQLPTFNNDDPRILRLFGSSAPVRLSRLQFADCFVINAAEMSPVSLIETKWENVIDRRSSLAYPRQIERVTPGTVFGVEIVYNVADADEATEDLALLAKAMRLLQLDYLGGSGTRGSGRVSLRRFRLTPFVADLDTERLTALFREVEDYELFPVQASL